MADERTEKQKVKEITDKLEQGLKELFAGGVMLVNNHSFGHPVSIEKSFEMSVEILIAGIKTLED